MASIYQEDVCMNLQTLRCLLSHCPQLVIHGSELLGPKYGKWAEYSRELKRGNLLLRSVEYFQEISHFKEKQDKFRENKIYSCFISAVAVADLVLGCSSIGMIFEKENRRVRSICVLFSEIKNVAQILLAIYLNMKKSGECPETKYIMIEVSRLIFRFFEVPGTIQILLDIVRIMFIARAASSAAPLRTGDYFFPLPK